MILKDLVWDTMKRLQTHIQPSILHFQLYITKMHWVKHVQDWTTVFSSSWFSFSVSYHRKWLILHLWWKVCGDHDWNWKCRRGKDVDENNEQKSRLAWRTAENGRMCGKQRCFLSLKHPFYQILDKLRVHLFYSPFYSPGKMNSVSYVY